jgi:hypothetical protein
MLQKEKKKKETLLAESMEVGAKVITVNVSTVYVYVESSEYRKNHNMYNENGY